MLCRLLDADAAVQPSLHLSEHAAPQGPIQIALQAPAQFAFQVAQGAIGAGVAQAFGGPRMLTEMDATARGAEVTAVAKPVGKQRWPKRRSRPNATACSPRRLGRTPA